MMDRWQWLPLALLSLGLVLIGCPDQFTIPDRDDDDDSADDDASDDDVGDDDTQQSGPTPAEVQDHLDGLGGWPIVDGCGSVTVFAVSPGNEVEVKFDASIDFAGYQLPNTEQYDIPGPGAALSIKAGNNMGSSTCGGGGSPDVTDNYSIQSGHVQLHLATGVDPVATVTISGVSAQRVGGDEIVTLPDIALPSVPVDWN